MNMTTTTVRPDAHDSGQEPFRPSPSPHTRRRGWVWLIVIVVVCGATYWMYRQYEASQAARRAKLAAMQIKAVPITTGAVKKGDIGVYLEGIGTVTPVYTVQVVSRVQGQITAIHYTEGQMVREGDPLIDIDPRPYEAALTQAQGQLARDEASLAQARIDLDRYRAALARNAVAQQQVYDQEQLVKQYEGVVTNDQGVVDNAKVNLVYCHITSPIAGRVGLRLVDLGNMVQANGTSPLVVVTQLQPITIIFTLDQGYLPQIQQRLRTGHPMAVYALDRTDETQIATGSLLTLDNEVDPTTGTVKLRAIFPNKDNVLFPNQFVNAKLLVDTERGVNLVPTQAIQRNGQGAFVYLVEPDDTAHIQNVTVGTTDGNVAAVEGIEAGQNIALNGFDKLQDGIKVVIRGNRGAGQTAASAPTAGGSGATTPAAKTTGAPGSGSANRGRQAP
ncbi:MAG TPA: efflux RND transporter periplasmic adaptor subunit [Candidatus Cybelea sp.]|nr:efflux RND transporter periplasmic adaptor subunit [Candidatus Cybelea sp.]